MYDQPSICGFPTWMDGAGGTGKSKAVELSTCIVILENGDQFQTVITAEGSGVITVPGNCTAIGF